MFSPDKHDLHSVTNEKNIQSQRKQILQTAQYGNEMVSQVPFSEKPGCC